MDPDPVVVSTLLFISIGLSVLISITEQYFLSTSLTKLELAVKQGDRLAIHLQRLLSHNIVELPDTIWIGKLLSFCVLSTCLQLLLGFHLIISLFLLLIICGCLVLLPKVFQVWIKRSRLGKLFYVFQIVHYYVFFIPAFLSVSLIRRIVTTANGDTSKSFLLPFQLLENGKISPEPVEEIETEVQLLQNALDFSKVKVRDCLIPRTEMVSIPVEATIDELRDKFIETHFSKILVYSNEAENVIGYVHSHDLFKKPANIKSILLPVFVVPETMNAQELFEQFVKEKRSIAIVLDEFGGTAGMVTIEDVIEEIFGEIEDEHDVISHTEEKLSDSEFLFSGRLEIDYLNGKYNLSIPESEKYDTIAGYVLDQLEEIPLANACLETELFLITVQEVSDRRIELIQLKVKHEN